MTSPSILLQHNFGDCVFSGVRDRKMCGGGAALFVQFARAAMKKDHRRA